MSAEPRLYLSGPMTGIPDSNYPAFNAAAAQLRALGYSVFNPAESLGGDSSRPRSEYMRLDIAEVLCCDAVVLLPGWMDSRGAALEVAIALEIGVPVLDAGTLEPVSAFTALDRPELFVRKANAQETVLEEAQRLVMGDRGEAYGHPLDDYEKTSALWTVVLGPKLKPGRRVSAEDAVLCMVAVKLSREVHRHKRDNLVDMAGYTLCLQRIVEERERRRKVVPVVRADGLPFEEDALAASRAA